MIERMLGASRLNAATYEDVEHDTGATGQALAVVALVGVAEGIGAGLDTGGGPGSLVFAVVGHVVMSIIGWYVWSAITLLVGTRLFNGTANMGEMQRTLGFAMTPRLLNVFGFVPVLGGILGIVTLGWSLVTGVVAVRQALDFDTGNAVATVVVGFVAQLVIAFLIGLVIAAFTVGSVAMMMR